MSDAEPAEKASPRNIGINPEELLVLPTSARGGALDGPRRRDLFSALRLRRDATSSREKRRRRQTREGRQSVEVLAGMLTRTGRDARLSKADEQQTSGGRHITLLRAGCQRPVIQQLHEVGEVGLGRAVALTGGDASDLDSGISEWGSCDERESAAFEALLDEEARNRRKLWNHPWSETPSCSSNDSPPPPPRPRARRFVPSSVWREKPAIVAALPEGRPEVLSKPETKESTTTMDKGASKMERAHPAAAAPSLIVAAAEECHQCTPTVPSVREVERCSEGTQCSGPPVNVGVQTSTLRLPRKKSSATRERVVHARPPDAPPPERSIPAKERLEKAAAAAAKAEMLRGGTFFGETPRSEPTGGGKRGARTTTKRMHVRVGLEGLEGADRGQEPTVWAMAGGSRGDIKASGPFVMLPLEGNEQRGAAPCGVKMFLSVDDFTAEPDVTAVVAGGISSDDTRTVLKSRRDNASSFFDPARGKSVRGRRSRQLGLAGIEDEERGEEGGEEKRKGEEEEEAEEEEEEWQKSRLDPLWTGVGSLGERLTDVGFLFDQLEGEMDHDRQVVENYQNEAQEEVKMAARDLEGIRAQRVSDRSGTVFVRQVPLWRRSPRTEHESKHNGVTREGTTPSPSPSAEKQRSLVPGGGGGGGGSDCGSFFFCGSDGGGGGDDEYLGGEVAALKAEEELWEARALLESIERELNAGNGATPASITPGAHPLAPAAASAVTSPPGTTTEKAGEPAMRRSSRSSSPPAFPQRTEPETPKKVSNAGSARSHNPPGRTLGDDPRLRRRRAVLGLRSTGQPSSARANGNSGNSGKSCKPTLDGSSIHSSNRKKGPGVTSRPWQNGEPMFDRGSIHSSSRIKGLGVSCRRVTGRAVSAKKGGDGLRSTGTAVAHFPTAVAATARSKARDMAATRRSRGS